MSEPTVAPQGTSPTAKKAPAKKTTVKTSTAKKTPAKKASAKKASAKKTSAGRTSARSTAATKPPAKKAPAKRAPAKKAAARSRAASSTGRLHPHRTVEERIARGVQWREAAPLEGQARFDVDPSRPSALGMLQAQDSNRLSDLVPLRYGRMSASAFSFYRGSAAVMAYDLAQQPYTPGGTQICGDAHLSNFGFFGSPERDLVFDVNDFDETLPGPFEWDVKRLVVSVLLAARDRGFKRKEGRAAALAAVESYRNIMGELAQMGNLEIWYTKIDAQEIRDAILRLAPSKKVAKKGEAKLSSIFDKARGKTSLRAAQKLTEVVDGERRFLDEPPILVRQIPEPREREQLEAVYTQYRATLQNDRRWLLERYRWSDFARKVVGVGSVGTRAYVMLMEGRDVDDPLVLQVKQASQSVLEPHLRASRFENHGERVVQGQRYMQAASDIFLGWTRGPAGNDFYVRQLHDMKGSLDLTKIQPIGLVAYARLCGATLARAHARGGDVVAISTYLGDDDTFGQAVVSFAERYADQAERDYAELTQAIADGTVEVTTGI
jgi:uncharacterized protein (DUF2252 family)